MGSAIGYVVFGAIGVGAIHMHFNPWDKDLQEEPLPYIPCLHCGRTPWDLWLHITYVRFEWNLFLATYKHPKNILNSKTVHNFYRHLAGRKQTYREAGLVPFVVPAGTIPLREPGRIFAGPDDKIGYRPARPKGYKVPKNKKHRKHKSMKGEDHWDANDGVWDEVGKEPVDQWSGTPEEMPSWDTSQPVIPMD